MLLDAILLKVGHDERQDGIGLAGSNLVKHLDDGDLAAALKEELGGLGTHQAAPDDGDAAGDLGLAGKDVPGRNNLVRVGTGDGDEEIMGAHGHDGGVEGVELVGGRRVVELDAHAEARKDLLVVLDGAHDLALARGSRGEDDLAAEVVGRLEERDVVAALGGDAGGLEAGDAAAHDGDALLALAGLDRDGGLVAVLGVEHARDVTAVLDGVDAALVAVEALADRLVRGGLQCDVGVAHERAAVGDDVG